MAPRLGYSEDLARKAHILAAGVSLIVEGWAIEVSYRHAILGDEKNVGIALRMLDF